MNIYEQISNRIPLSKGWSADKKYHILTSDGNSYLLRISALDRLDRKHLEYTKMQEVAALGIPMCVPFEFGTCEDGVYTIQSWIDGQDAEALVPTLSADEQYTYGFEAGQIQKKIHTIPAPSTILPWENRYGKKIDTKLQRYQDCPLKYDNGQVFIDYIGKYRHLIRNRNTVFQHGDFHRGNMMFQAGGKLMIIDFDRCDFGDPWEDLAAITWDADLSPAFASGRIDGYFCNDVPEVFWRLLKLYICVGELSSLPWAIPYGQKEIDTILSNAENFLNWYDGAESCIPVWYGKP